MLCHVMLCDSSYPAFQNYLGLVAECTCETMELCSTKAENLFRNLKVGVSLVYTPWDTLLLSLGGARCRRGFLFVMNKISDSVRCGVRTAC